MEDRRKTRKRGLNHFKDDWLLKTDNNGDVVGSYLTRVGEFRARCIWCRGVIRVENMGYIAIKRHSETQGHIKLAQIGRNGGISAVHMASDDVKDDTESNYEDTTGDALNADTFLVKVETNDTSESIDVTVDHNSNIGCDDEDRSRINFPSFVADFLKDVIQMKEFENVLKQIREKITHLSFLVQLMCKYEDFDRVYSEYKSVQEDLAGGNIGWEDDQYFREWEKLHFNSTNLKEDDGYKVKKENEPVCIDIMKTELQHDLTEDKPIKRIKKRRLKNGGTVRAGRNHYRKKWLQKTDSNGDLVGWYIVKIGEFTVKCVWCNKEISVSNGGFTAVKRHSECQSHVKIAELGRTGKPAIVANDDDGVPSDIVNKSDKEEHPDLKEIDIPLKKMECRDCNLKWTSKKPYLRHLFEKHEQKLCYQCGVLSEDFHQFWLHRYTRCSAIEKIDTCHICTLQFTSRFAYENHMKDWHDIMVETQIKKRKTGGKPTICQECGVKTKHLKSHMRKHEKNPIIYNCDQCDYRTDQKHHLKKHILAKHTETVLTPCPYCGARVKGLKRHLKFSQCYKPDSEKIDESIPCSECGKILKSVKGVAKHMREVHGEEKQCEFCDFKTKYAFNMRSHVKTVHEKRPLKETCPHCNKECVSLEWHISTYHSVS